MTLTNIWCCMKSFSLDCRKRLGILLKKTEIFDPIFFKLKEIFTNMDCKNLPKHNKMDENLTLAPDFYKHCISHITFL